MTTADFLVVGGGIVGISIARELKRRFVDASVILLEKEHRCGLHASGRNSGVLHAGFYYTSDSLKARFAQIGNRRLVEYCELKRLPINRCGKLVVARDAADLGGLDELLKRAQTNGIALHDFSEKEAKEVEPRVKTFGRALFSPTTSTVDPVAIVSALSADAVLEGVKIRCGVRYMRKRAFSIRTSDGDYDSGHVINAAGLYADRIARDYGFADEYRILPFKGLYLYSDEPIGAIRTNIYPVPNLQNPFLGVHFTVTVSGQIKIGPTAIPAFWREQYGGIANFRLREFSEIAVRSLGLLISSPFDFKRLAVHELAKYSRARMVALSATLVEGVKTENYRRWASPGIRAQLLNLKKKRLEMDFVIQGDKSSTHVLNAVSPAFTCSLPFAEYVCDRVSEAQG
jgi:L-2-hydroxyglutarate oxidase